jgi:hypothetical protein
MRTQDAVVSDELRRQFHDPKGKGGLSGSLITGAREAVGERDQYFHPGSILDSVQNVPGRTHPEIGLVALFQFRAERAVAPSRDETS